MKTYNERINSINAKVKQKRKRRAAIWTAGSVACVLLVLTVVCSLPILGEGVPNVNAYKNDEYYKVIEKINSRYSDNRYSVFEQIGNTINKGFGAPHLPIPRRAIRQMKTTTAAVPAKSTRKRQTIK